MFFKTHSSLPLPWGKGKFVKMLRELFHLIVKLVCCKFLLVSCLLLFPYCMKSWPSWGKLQWVVAIPSQKQQRRQLEPPGAKLCEWSWLSMRSVGRTEVSFPKGPVDCAASLREVALEHLINVEHFLDLALPQFLTSVQPVFLGLSCVFPSRVASRCLLSLVPYIKWMQLSCKHSTKPCASLEISGKASKLLRGSRGSSFLFWSAGPF